MHIAPHAAAFFGPHLLRAYGYPALTLMLAVECAGVLLPGETLMVAAALLASHGKLNIYFVLASASGGAMLGSLLGYGIGRWLGAGLLARHGARIGLHAGRQALGRYLFTRHGGKVIFFTRFVAALRSFASVLAGANMMPWRAFLCWSVVGAVIWPSAVCGSVFVMGRAAARLSGAANIAFGIAAVGTVAAVLYIAHRNEHRMTEAAMRWQEQHGPA